MKNTLKFYKKSTSTSLSWRQSAAHFVSVSVITFLLPVFLDAEKTCNTNKQFILKN